jgi:hypothetical protein
VTDPGIDLLCPADIVLGVLVGGREVDKVYAGHHIPAFSCRN